MVQCKGFDNIVFRDKDNRKLPESTRENNLWLRRVKIRNITDEVS